MEEYKRKYLIGAVAKMLDISAGSIRHYEKIGLIRSLKENANNYRHFNIHLLEQVSNIMMFRSLGLSLDEIRSIQGAYDKDIDQIIGILQRQIDKNDEDISRLKRASRKLRIVQNQFERIMSSIGKIAIRESPQFIFTSLRNILDTEELITNYHRLINDSPYLPKYTFIISKDDILNGNFSLDSYSQFGVCVESAEALSSGSIVIPSRTCAYSVYIGNDVGELGNKYRNMLRWIDENGYSLAAEVLELCDICIGNDYLFELYLPIAPRK